MPTITQLKYITAVDKYKHFGKAAESCNVSQPSLSAQISKVEEDLNTIIFDRTKKPILTTDYGKIIIEQAKKVLQEHQRLLNLQIDNNKIQGKFNLSVIPTLSSYVVPLFIESFSKKYPEVELTINENKTSEIIELLNEDKIDAGLLVTPIDSYGIEEYFLFYEPFYVYASEKHPLSKKTSVSEKDLDPETLWLLNEGHCFRDQVIKLCNLKSKKHVFNNIFFESGNLETLKNLIKQGQGYTLLPELATLDLSKEEKLKHLIAIKKPVPTRQVSLVYSRKINKEKIIKALADEITGNIPENLKKLKKQNIDVIPVN